MAYGCKLALKNVNQSDGFNISVDVGINMTKKIVIKFGLKLKLYYRGPVV